MVGGGSTTPETVSGKFIDAAVAGLNYACSSGKTDITDGEGQYTCNVGDKVSFSLGGYSIGGEVDAASGIVTPDTLWPNDADAALNVAQLIQTVTTTDADGNLVVPENFTALDDSTIEINSTDFDTDMEAALPDYTFVSEADAEAHLDESATLVSLAGKTFYNASTENFETLVFNADGTSITITDLADGSSETISISIDGDTITPANEYEPVTVLEILDGRIVLEGETWVLDQPERAKTLLANNTWVATGFTVTFNADVTSLTINGGEATETATLDGMLLTHNGETDLIAVVSDTEIQLFDPRVGDWTVFFLEGADIPTSTTTAPDTTGTTTIPVTTTSTSTTTTPDTTTTPVTATKDFLAGKTFYLSDAEGRESLTFSADMTIVTITDLNDGQSFQNPISIDGDTITDAYGTFIVDMNSLTTDTITFYSNDNPTGVKAPETLYLNQEDRLRSLLANNTLVSQDQQGFSVTFNADVTSATIVENGGQFTDTVTLNGMTLTHSDGTDLITISNDTTLIFNPGTLYPETFILQ